MSGPDDAAVLLTAAVTAEFRRRLHTEYVPRIGACLALLDEARVWQRPAPNCNSIGNLILHLAGNVTQWIMVPFGGQDDHRHRPAEFAAEHGDQPANDPAALLQRLEAVVAEACAITDRLTSEQLLTERLFQERYRETGLGAVLHVLEHFSGHAAQIYAWTKQLTGRDLAFYDL